MFIDYSVWKMAGQEKAQATCDAKRWLPLQPFPDPTWSSQQLHHLVRGFKNWLVYMGDLLLFEKDRVRRANAIVWRIDQNLTPDCCEAVQGRRS